MSESLHVIALAQAADVGDQDLPETAVLYTGTFEHTGRKFDVTEADLDAAVQNFNAQLAAGTEIPVDYEHGAAEGGVAAGWYKSLRREGSKLLAKIAWTDKAKSQLTAGERRYFSPEFTPAAKDESGGRIGFKLLAGALVTRPHLKSLGAVAFTEAARDALANECIDMRQLMPGAHMGTAALGDSTYHVTYTAGNLQGGVAYSLTPVVVAPKDAAMAEPTVTAKEVQDLTAALTEAKDEVATLSERVTAAEQRADAAETAQAETAKALFTEQVNARLAKARREGRIDAKEETDAEMLELAEKLGLDGLQKILDKFPAETIPMTERGHGADIPVTDSDAPEGVDPDSYKAAKLAEQYESEGLSADEAASKAYKEVYV